MEEALQTYVAIYQCTYQNKKEKTQIHSLTSTHCHGPNVENILMSLWRCPLLSRTHQTPKLLLCVYIASECKHKHMYSCICECLYMEGKGIIICAQSSLCVLSLFFDKIRYSRGLGMSIYCLQCCLYCNPTST